jgi:hypothetical protein
MTEWKMQHINYLLKKHSSLKQDALYKWYNIDYNVNKQTK